MLTLPITNPYYRVVDPDWPDPLDPAYAATGVGQRWNPAGLPCLYLNHDIQTARANVNRLFVGLPYGPADLDPATAPLLVGVDIPSGIAADAFTDAGFQAMGLPTTYPRDASGAVVAHSICQPHGKQAFDAGHDGVDARAAAEGGLRELAWFPRERIPTETSRDGFEEWW